MFYISFHELITLAREEAGLTKSEVSRKLGIPYATYDSYEKGTRIPSAKAAFVLFDFFKIDLVNSEYTNSEDRFCYRELLFGQDEPPSDADGKREQEHDISLYFKKLNSKGRRRLLDIAADYAKIPEYIATSDVGEDPDSLRFSLEAVQNPSSNEGK